MPDIPLVSTDAESTTEFSHEEPVDDAALLASGIELGYGDGTVVDCEDLVVPSGEVTALVGPNGSGKSTLLKGLSAELDPSAGTVLLNGRAVQER